MIKYSLFLAVIICLMACNQGKADKKDTKGQSKSVSNLEGFVVKPSLLKQSISISGSLKPFEETTLMPDVTGRVVKVAIEEGQKVKQGTLLVKLFDYDLQAQLHKAQTQLQIAELTSKRQSELVKVEGISQADYDQSALLVNSIKSDIDIIKAQIRKTEVLAPFDGVIGLKNISVGAVVSPSTSLAIIRLIEKLKLDFSVPEKYSRQVQTGSKVWFSVQGDEKKYQATVMATEQGVDLNTRNLKVRAIVLSNSALIPGTFANVELDLKEKTSALLIPTQAIIPKERNKQVIVSKNGIATLVTVHTGVRQNMLIEVLNGITAGDTIATTGILFIKPKSELKFSKVN